MATVTWETCPPHEHITAAAEDTAGAEDDGPRHPVGSGKTAFGQGRGAGRLGVWARIRTEPEAMCLAHTSDSATDASGSRPDRDL